MPKILEYRTCSICGKETLACYFGDGIKAPLNTCLDCIYKAERSASPKKGFDPIQKKGNQ